MKRFKMKLPLALIGAGFGLSVSISPSITASPMSSIADNLYGSFTTTGGVVSRAGGRTSFIGGAASLRFNPREITAVSFTPPSVSASCSGIDFFTGAFSILKADRLIASARNIAAAAGYYGFRLAFNSVCASCQSIMQSIQNILRRLNELANVSCEQALDVMNSYYDPSDPNNDVKNLPSNAVLNTVSNGFTEVEDLLGATTDRGQHWIEYLRNNGKTLDDVRNQSGEPFLASISDVGFLIAFNTEAPMFILPWLVSGDYKIGTPTNNLVAKTALWKLLSESKECPNGSDPKALVCGIKERNKLQWTFLDLIHGKNGNTEGERITFHAPTCSTYKVTPHDSNYVNETALSKKTKVVCNIDDGATVSVTSDKPIQALAPFLLKDFYGQAALKSNSGANPEPDVDKVCNGEVLNSSHSDGAFYKLLTNNSTTAFTSAQSHIIKYMGVEYTYDLPLLGKNGRKLNPNEAGLDCKTAFNHTYKRITQIINDLKLGVFPGFERAIRSIREDQRINDQVRELYIGKIKELESSVRDDFNATFQQK